MSSIDLPRNIDAVFTELQIFIQDKDLLCLKQNALYHLQASTLKILGKKLFDEKLQKWNCGPVFTQAWNSKAKHLACNREPEIIQQLCKAILDVLYKEEIITLLIDSCSPNGPFGMTKILNDEITDDALDYYPATQLELSCFEAIENILDPDPPITSWACFGGGWGSDLDMDEGEIASIEDENLYMQWLEAAIANAQKIPDTSFLQ